MSEWISFFDKQPEVGQMIYYYGPPIGVWRGVYAYEPDDAVSPHIIHCAERPGVVDRMDAPWWQPFDGQTKPAAPTMEYPSDYPKASQFDEQKKDDALEVNMPALQRMVRQINAIAHMRQALHDALPGGWESYPNATEVDALLAEAGMFEEDE